MWASWLGRYCRYIAGSLLTGTTYTENILTGNMYHVQKVYLFAPRQSSVGFLDWVSQSWIHNPGLGFACMLSFILFLFGQAAFSFTLWFFYGKESRMKVGLPLSTQRRTNCVFLRSRNMILNSTMAGSTSQVSFDRISSLPAGWRWVTCTI